MLQHSPTGAVIDDGNTSIYGQYRRRRESLAYHDADGPARTDLHVADTNM